MTNHPQVGELGRVFVPRPALPKRKSVVVRFLEKVDVQPDGCWLWTGEVSANGYGGFRHPETKWAHRAAYLLLVGPIPEGMTIDHLCYVKTCVNPDHLDVVPGELNRQRESQGWSECDGLHPDTPTRVGHKRNRVFCKECHRVREMERRARRAAENSGLAAPRLPLAEGSKP